MENKELQIVNIGQKEIDTLVACSIIPPGTPSAQIEVFGRVCKEKGLSPFSRQIYLMAKNSKNGVRYTTITGIDGYRVLAERTGTYAGNDDYTFDEGLTQYQMLKDKRSFPTVATATVYKLVGGQIVPFKASAMWDAYYPGDLLGFMWKKMPFLMLGKCAEALAMRKAFPEALGGIYTDVEMEQADNEKVKITEPKTAEREITIELINACKTIEELQILWNSMNKVEQKAWSKTVTVKKGALTNGK